MLFPKNIGFLQVEPLSNSPAYISESKSLKTVTTSTGAQRWEWTLTTDILNEVNFRRGWAFLNSLAGKTHTFDIQLPLFSEPLGVVSGLVQSMASHGIGENVVNFTNYIAEIGDFVRFVGHSKTYQIIDTAGSSATLFPPLIKPVSSSEVVQVSDLLFTARLNSSISKLKVPSTKKAKLKFKNIEAF